MPHKINNKKIIKYKLTEAVKRHLCKITIQCQHVIAEKDIMDCVLFIGCCKMIESNLFLCSLVSDTFLFSFVSLTATTPIDL